MKFAAAMLLTLSLAGAPVLAADTRVGAIEIEHPWARASATANGAMYMEIENKGAAADKLVAASTAAAAKAELHTHLLENGIARMRPVDAIEVTPGSPTVLRPGGLHVMLIGLKKPLQIGDTITVTLTFEKAGRVDVTVPVQRSAAGMGQGDMPHGTMPHGDMPHGTMPHGGMTN